MKHRFSQWLPLLATSLLGALTLMIYTWVLEGKSP